MAKSPSQFSITKRTKKRIPRLPFARFSERILGKNHAVSLVFVDSKESKALNRKYRKKNKPANVLTFPYAKHEGEIFIDLAEVKRSAPLFFMNEKKMLALVFIHALLHLKGTSHGSTMEKEEMKWLAKLGR